MPEQARSATVTVEVDTNKRTVREVFTGPDAMERAQDWLDDLAIPGA